jgi:phosphatidylglycerophosphatase A
MKKETIKFIATLGGIGYLPIFGGTAGSLAGMLYFMVIGKGMVLYVSVAIGIVLSFMVSGPAEKIFEEKDSRRIIIDDFTGMLISYLFIPEIYHLGWVVAVFLLFRVFDSLKLYPINKIEEKDGSWGVLGDDVAAAIYAGICTLILQKILTFFRIG